MSTLDSDGVYIGAGEFAFSVDADRTIGDADDRFLCHVDCRRDAIVGADVASLRQCLGDGFGSLRQAIDDVLQGDASRRRCAVTLGTTPEARTPVTARVTPLVGGGEVDGALVTCRPDEEEAPTGGPEETHRHYETLVEESRDGVTITQDKTNVFVNARFAEMLGYERSELVGESVLKPIAGEDHETVRRRYRKRIRGESPPNRYELRLRTKSGERVTVEVNVNRIDYDGAPAVLTTYRDITERREREEKLRRFRRAIETAPHAIFLTDRSGQITYVNPAFEETTGYTSEEAIGETPALFQSGKQDDAFYEELWETILDGEVWEGYVVNERKSGDYYHAHETIAPITDDGTVAEFVAIQTDISQRVERERLVNTFDRVLRHNLRNRLNVIESHGSLIRTRADHAVDDHVEKILDSVDSLLATTQKGRQIVKHLSQPSHRKSIDIAAVVREVVADATGDYPDSVVTVEAPEQAQAKAVAEIADGIAELLENAIEHNDRTNPEVSVRVDVADDTVRVRIADDGPGISEMERQILDETADIDQLYHGSGFGLWLVYWVVRRSNGTVSIADRTPRGTEVTLELPRRRGGADRDDGENTNMTAQSNKFTADNMRTDHRDPTTGRPEDDQS